MPRLRRIVHYSGSVQGVGFRATTHRLAKGFPVQGYVKNLPDGRVRVEAQGEPGDVEAFLDAIQKRMGNYIDDAKVEPTTDLEDFDGFEVRFR